jgi:hypothetical protein
LKEKKENKKNNRPPLANWRNGQGTNRWASRIEHVLNFHHKKLKNKQTNKQTKNKPTKNDGIAGLKKHMYKRKTKKKQTKTNKTRAPHLSLCLSHSRTSRLSRMPTAAIMFQGFCTNQPRSTTTNANNKVEEQTSAAK